MCRWRAAQELHRANQACSALKLLRRQHSQRIAHQNVGAVARRLSEVSHLQALVEHVERHNGEIRFCLATARWKPDQVNDLSVVGVVSAGASERHQKERDLESAPEAEVGVLTILRVDVPGRVANSVRSDNAGRLIPLQWPSDELLRSDLLEEH